MKMSDETVAVDTETEPETEAKTEEPDGAKAEEPMEQDEVEKTPTETKSTQESENQMENIIETIGGAAPVAEKGLKDILSDTFRGVDAKSRFSVATPDIKAFIGTPQWLPTVSRNVAGYVYPYGFADLFGQETISGNAYTFVQLAEGSPATVVAEGGEKPDITTIPDVVTLPLTKVAGWIQESDELIEDADWLVSAIENRGVRALKIAKDAKVFTDLNTAISSAAISGGATEASILTAISNVRANGYEPDTVAISPSDYATLVTASLSNSRTLLGPDYKTFLGIPIYQYANLTNTIVVGAFKDGATVVGKGGVRIEATNSDQNDFIHNLVKVRIEERLALAVRDPFAFQEIVWQ